MKKFMYYLTLVGPVIDLLKTFGHSLYKLFKNDDDLVDDFNDYDDRRFK